MARLISRAKMGFLPIDEIHQEAILSLVKPATSAHKLLDPFAGEGTFLEVASQAWQMTAYANELDGARAQVCIEKFGITQAVRSDALRLRASNRAFSCLWVNPPYDIDKIAKNSKRVEFAMLRHSWKWAQDGGLVLWAVYQHHLTTEAMSFLAKNSRQVDVWAIPGKHLGEYDQIIVAAVVGHQPDPSALYQQIEAQKQTPRMLEVQAEPIYQLPVAPKPNRFVFTADMIDAEQGLQLVETLGAWQSATFQNMLSVLHDTLEDDIEPVVAPRPGHMALVLAAGVANGAIIESREYGRVVIRGKTQAIEEIAKVETVPDDRDPERSTTKTTIRLKPTTVLSLLSSSGTIVEMKGDDALLDFIRNNKQALAEYLNERFTPMYDFGFNGIKPYLDAVRLKGKYEMYTAQKHVVAAITRGFEQRDSILLIGSMGTGKTLLGGTTAIAVTSGIIKSMREDVGADQVSLIVAPPHLIEKWQRELLSINPNSYIAHLKRHEDVKAFMNKAEKLGAGIPKIGLIKRDMTKLGTGRDVAVVWRERRQALWKQGEPTPEGYEDQERIFKQSVPTCPHCGQTVMQEKKEGPVVASKTWLKAGKRNCLRCDTPLWQEARDRGSRPKAGQKYPRKNPRYRLDQYLKKNYSDRVYLLVWDEVHECANGDTGNGESFGRMAGFAKKVLGMTGTPFNGRSSSLFNLEYHLNARVRQRYPIGGASRLTPKMRGSAGFQGKLGAGSQRGRAESMWVEDMGVLEQIVEDRPTYDRETGAYTGTSTYTRPFTEAPGISPLLVAEILDHSVFFSLDDLNKHLPAYEEIAMPVEMDADTYNQYDSTRRLLKDYLIEKRWDGDTTFRGAYLQWSMGWPSASFRPTDVIHNIKHPITGEKMPHSVTKIPSFGEKRIFAKEQALIDVLQEELAENRPCVVYIRQSGTRDIQPRIEALIRDNVSGAKPFILKNTVGAEKREKVIETERAKGMNVLITNPELVKTGLDLIFAPTLIFYEISFNLSTQMQAAARSYRLNQTHDHCKTIYMFALNTMEHTAVQLMSRKQRAAKLLTGNIGLTGLDELTNGEGGFEAALLNAISQEEALDDPRDMFKIQSSELDAEDANYWQIEEAVEENDDLIKTALNLGAVLRQVPDNVEEAVIHDDVGQTEIDNKPAPSPVYMEGVLAGMGLGRNDKKTTRPMTISARTDANANAILASMGMSSKAIDVPQSAKPDDDVEDVVNATPALVVEDPALDEENDVTTKELVLASFGFSDTTYVLSATPDVDETVPAVADPVADEAVAVVAKPVVNETIAIVAKPVADEVVPAVSSKIIDFQAVSQQKVTTKPKRRRKVNLDAVPDDDADIRQLAMF
ncbi:MAG: hypothetical protein Crog4KO_34680 [Crocinitomicaceae bacterium]